MPSAVETASNPTVALTLALTRANAVSGVVAAELAQLRDRFAQERTLRRHVELELRSAQSELARAKHLLEGTLAGRRRALQLALHDSLTALPNRRFLSRRLNAALSRQRSDGRSLAVMFLDLDGFKAINDTQGHAVGDAVLKIVALRLSRAMRAGDSVGRCGGDEFACILSGWENPQQLAGIANKILATVSARIDLSGLSFEVRPSIGIAQAPQDGACAEALLTNADAAMYAAKRSRAGFAFYAELQAAAKA
jgi:diguanylate cyclase (GGDEF)-like protein